MGLLDFVKGCRNAGAEPKRNGEQTRTVTPTQDVKAALTPEQLAKFREVGERMAKGTDHLRQAQPKMADASGSDSNSALRQKQNNQDKTQAALSPTDQYAGKPAASKKTRSWER